LVGVFVGTVLVAVYVFVGVLDRVGVLVLVGVSVCVAVAAKTYKGEQPSLK